MPNSRLLKHAAAFLLTTALTAPAATGQVASELDRLLGESTGLTAVRSVDPETRASKRFAIVIGNSDYDAIPDLPNAYADARAMTSFLRAQGYTVHHREDLTKRGFEDVLRRVLFDVDRDTEVTVFFAGHGFQIGADNYLVPSDADLDSVYDVPFEAVSLGSLVGIIGARARLQLVILDSCRDNPFAGKAALTEMGNELREARTGFSSQAAPLNSMIMYSTAPGALAFDGEGENSPFTAALVDEASEEPEALVKDIFVEVRRSVFEATNGRQVPWDSSTLVEPASFGLGNAIQKPIAVSSNGIGVSRGLARILPTSATTTEEAQPASFSTTSLEVDFVPEVEIGYVLANALDLTPADKVTIVENPKTGRLVLPDATGFQRDILDQPIAASDLDRLILVNESVQIPAVSLDTTYIEDSLRVSVAGEVRQVNLRLTPNACDFEAGDHLDPDGMGLTRYANELRPEAALAACKASIDANPNVSRFHYQKGRALVALRQTDEAKAAFETARDLGHTRAWHALGNALVNEIRETSGASSPVASEEALMLYAEGVSRGDPYAYYSLGRQFMRYGDTDAIEVEGYDLMMRALEVGHTFAMNELGYFYLDESGEFYDPERGLRYLNESAARSDIYGYNNMGLVYLRGLGGVEPDYALAQEMFLKAADGGHPDAPFNLAQIERDGLVGAPNPKAALEWYDTGLNRGDAYSGGEATLLIFNTGVEGKDVFDAAVYAAKAAALTNHGFAGQARDLLGQIPAEVLEGGTERLVAELGEPVQGDGALDAGERAAIERILQGVGPGSTPNDPVQLIVSLAGVVWRESPFRVDLY